MEGTVVIVDVFRAFTTASIAFSWGADRILLVAQVEEALDLRGRGLGDLCMGEVGACGQRTSISVTRHLSSPRPT